MKNSFILILLCLLFSCSDKRKSENIYTEPTMSCNDISSLQPIRIGNPLEESLYNYIDSIEVIPLETNEECLIGDVSKVTFFDNKIFVADTYRSSKVFVFDLDGNYLYSIGVHGKAYGEYLLIGDINITDQYVDFVDCGQWKVVRYNLYGEVIKEINLAKAFGTSHFIELNTNRYMLIFQNYADEHPFRVEIRDSLLNIKETALPFLYVRDEPAGQVIKDHKGNYLYYSLFNDTIYNITENSIKQTYSTSLYNQEEIDAFLRKTEGLKQRDFLRVLNSTNNQIVSFYSFFESERYFFIQYRKGGKLFNSIVDREHSTSKTTIGMSFNSGVGDFPFYIHGIHENRLVSSVTLDDIKQLTEDASKDFVQKLTKCSIKRWKRNKEDDAANPTICIFQIRDSI
ncbi:MAG: 6-bladed beta-propeller [Prevotella sp.]|nr:6-bladed beta-propeller [Prevotella sp.]